MKQNLDTQILGQFYVPDLGKKVELVEKAELIKKIELVKKVEQIKKPVLIEKLVLVKRLVSLGLDLPYQSMASFLELAQKLEC